ncbi:hypothetical protein V6N11_004378 [Hibiscus sabdariffa]|uniref:Uncharacterized protein n=1 Tax=Hibiscus sabdariffa TaxID=183260 RepID=A0ABR2SGP6_9ROSI
MGSEKDGVFQDGWFVPGENSSGQRNVMWVSSRMSQSSTAGTNNEELSVRSLAPDLVEKLPTCRLARRLLASEPLPTSWLIDSRSLGPDMRSGQVKRFQIRKYLFSQRIAQLTDIRGLYVPRCLSRLLLHVIPDYTTTLPI